MHVDGLPDGVVLEATAPDRVAVVWASSDLPQVFEALHGGGFLPLRLTPSETPQFVEVSGAPQLLLVDAAVLQDPASAAVLSEVRSASPVMRVCLVAGADAGAAGLRVALQLGLSAVVDPDDTPALREMANTPVSEPVERVLAVGAHPDDVEIGCAATLLRHHDLGHVVSALTLSRGAVGGPQAERRREAIGAAVAMGATLLMADFPDTRLTEHVTEMVTAIEGVIASVAPTTVYVHSKADNHQDHRAVHEATVIAARRVRQLLCYQSPSSRNEFAPTKFVPVEATIERKVEVLASYRSQTTRHYLDPELVVATARYWARQLPHARYAEPFEVLRASDA